MNLNWKTSLVLLLLPILLSGCWSRRELNDLAIQVAAGIDKVDGQYRLTSQVVEPSQAARKAGGSSRAPVTTYSSTGKTLFEAYREMTTFSPRRMYGAHLRMIVIGSSAARDGLSKVLDLFSRDHEFRTDFFIVVAKNTTAENMLKILTPLEKIPANKLYKSLEISQKYWAPSVGITLHDLLSDLTSDGKEPVLTAMELIGSQKTGESEKNVNQIEPEAGLNYVGLAIFKGDKQIGWFNEEESKGVTYIRNKVTSTISVLPCGNDGNITFEVFRSETKIKANLIQNEPQTSVKVNIEGNIGESSCSLDLSNPATIQKLEEQAEKSLEKILSASIKKARKLGVDIYGFGEEFKRNHHKYWETHRDRWNQIFKDMPVHLNVEVKLRHVGTIGNPFTNKKE